MTVLFSKTMVKSLGAVQIEPCVLAHVMLFASLVLVDGTIEMCFLERSILREAECAKVYLEAKLLP